MEQDRMMALLGKVVDDLGGAYSVPLVRMGEQLGLYAALDAGPATSTDLARRTGCAERYVREWLANQAGSGYVTVTDATVDQPEPVFSLSEEQAMLFARPDSPVYLIGAFDTAVSGLENQPMVERAFQTGDGVGWSDQSPCMACAVAKFFRPNYEGHLVADWLPALDGVVDRLTAGGRVADVGCGHGFSTLIMARAFPKAEVVGFDFHPESIQAAQSHAQAHGIDNVRFEVAAAKDFAGSDYDLVTCFDCLHDMGDPAGAARHVRQALAPKGRWMIVEPLASDRLSDNLNPVGRLYYAASTMICVPTSLAQEVGTALGAQAGEARLRQIIEGSGFGSVRRAAETPFNMILEASA
jgi:SAM-dependent methyltransferase